MAINEKDREYHGLLRKEKKNIQIVDIRRLTWAHSLFNLLSIFYPVYTICLVAFFSLPVTSVSVICEAAVESNPELYGKANTREDNL